VANTDLGREKVAYLVLNSPYDSDVFEFKKTLFEAIDGNIILSIFIYSPLVHNQIHNP